MKGKGVVKMSYSRTLQVIVERAYPEELFFNQRVLCPSCAFENKSTCFFIHPVTSAGEPCPYYRVHSTP